MYSAGRSISSVGFVPDIPSLDFRTTSLRVARNYLPSGGVKLKQARLSPINEEQLQLFVKRENEV